MNDKVQYLHCSFAGSYPIDCKILDVQENFSPPLSGIEKILNFKEQQKGLYFFIEYFDPNIEEIVQRWVTKDYILNYEKS